MKAVLVKILGGAVVFASCALLGLYYSLKDSFRIADLTEIKKALIMLKAEMELSSTLPEAMSRISSHLAGPSAAFFSTLGGMLMEKGGLEAAEIWRAALEKNLAHDYLTEEDLQCLERLGGTLGGMSKAAQADGAGMAIMYIDGKLAELRVTETRNKRLYRNVGVVGGLLITIFML